MSEDDDRKPWEPARVAAHYGISRELVYQLIHQGSFGPKGKGYRPKNPLAHAPRYVITYYGRQFYDRQTAA